MATSFFLLYVFKHLTTMLFNTFLLVVTVVNSQH
jgi:hypothetical protein